MDIIRADAVSLLRPNAQFALRDDVLEWYSSDLVQPTEAVIDAKLVEMQAEWDAQEYARNRAATYPSTGDQLDYIYHNGVAKWKTDMIDPIKDKYPKG